MPEIGTETTESYECTTLTTPAKVRTESSTAPLKVNMSPPTSFLCPLSGQLMTDPVKAADGNTCQRSSFDGRVSDGRTSNPLDEAPLGIQSVVPDYELSAEIEAWEESYLNSLPRHVFSLNSASSDPCACQSYASGELHFSGVSCPCPVQILKIPSDRIQHSAVALLRMGRHPYLARVRGICDDGEETLLATEQPLHGSLLDAIFKLNQQNQQAVSWHHRICMVQQICVALNFLEQTSSAHSCLIGKNVHLFQFCEKNPERTLVKLSGYAATPCCQESISRMSTINRTSILEEQCKESTKVVMFGILALRIISLRNLDSLITSNLEQIGPRKSFSSILTEDMMPQGCPVTMWMALKQCLHDDQSQRPSFSELSNKLLGADVEESTPPVVSRTVNIAIKSLTGKFTFIEVKAEASILQVKKVIDNKLGINPTAQRLVYNGRLLDDSRSLFFYGCHSGSVLHLVLRLRCIAAVAQPASFGQYKQIIDGGCLVDVESRENIDKARLHEVVRRSHGSLVLMPTLSRVRLLSLLSCKALIRYLDGYSRAFPTENDLTLSLRRHELKEIIQEQDVRILEKWFDSSYDLIRVRRTVSSDNWIPFHLDDCRRTMQVALNSEDDYEGGKLVFASGEGFLEPTRLAGFATIHSIFLVHGVTRLRRGVRYALFLCDMQGHYERKTIKYLIEASRKQLKFFEAAVEFLRGLDDEDILDYINEYTHFMEQKYKQAHEPNFGVELVWRCHMLNPVRYNKFCHILETRDTDGGLVEHLPRDPQSYCMQKKPVVLPPRSITRTTKHLLASVRTQHEFMKHVLSIGAMQSSPQLFAEAVEDYYGFLRHVGESSTTAVPSLMVDLVWHTHMLFPRRYEKECHLIVGRLVDHKFE